jgi:hypothetical protein
MPTLREAVTPIGFTQAHWMCQSVLTPTKTLGITTLRVITPTFQKRYKTLSKH